MTVSKHNVALFEEGFILVEVDYEDIQDYGETMIWEAVQDDAWIASQDIPVVIAYEDAEDGIIAYGDDEFVDPVTQMNFDEIVWNHELTLEWTDDEDDDFFDEEFDEDFDEEEEFDEEFYIDEEEEFFEEDEEFEEDFDESEDDYYGE